jgi:methyl-accepting chemotaxis protein
MSAAAEEGMTMSSSVAAASEEASMNVQVVARSVDELATSFGPISGKVSESSHIAESAKKIAIETNQNVTTLVDATNAISDVTKLISDIAAQTNLLALNATIEAARAGDAGRGFAIVASEVKNLAVQTARATEQIGRQIENVQTATGDTVEAIKTITGTIDQINGIAVMIADAVETQSIATREISSNIGQAAIGTLEVTTNIVGVKDAAAQTGDTATKLLAAAASLNEQSQHLANEVDAFLQAAKAA